MKRVFVFLMLCWGIGLSLQAQENKVYETAMVKMLEVSKSMEAMKQLAPQITAAMKQQIGNAQVPESFWTELESKMVTMYDRIIHALIPVYQKYLSVEDIQEIIKFYETPVGKKLAASNTQIAMEAMPIAQQIAIETMQGFMEEAKAKGYIK